MKTKLLMLTIAMSCTFAGSAMALTKEEYKTQKDAISATYKTNKTQCDTMKANAKDICVAEAKGTEKVAKAELEAQYKPSPSHDKKIRDTKANAAYDVAKEKCDDQTGNAKDVCVKDAKAARTAAKADAKVSKAATEARTGDASPAKVAEVRKDAAEDKRDADYAAAKERCDALAGNAKDACQADVKTKFGK